jgi:hypothetical protein
MGFFAAIAKRFQKQAPQPTRELVRAGSRLPTLALNNQFSRIGGAITPLQVSAIIQEADDGTTYRLVDLMNECRQKDCHLQ